MQVKALLYKAEPVFAHDPETLLSALGKSEVKMDSGKVKSCSLVRQIKIWNYFWKTWTSNKGLSGLLSVLGSKTCNSDGTWMHQFLWNCQLAHLKKQHHCWRVYTSFRATSRLHFFQWSLCIIEHDEDKPRTATITAAWLHRRRDQVLKWRPFTSWKHLAHHDRKNMTKTTQYNVTIFLSQMSSSWSPQIMSCC